MENAGVRSCNDTFHSMQDERECCNARPDPVTHMRRLQVVMGGTNIPMWEITYPLSREPSRSRLWASRPDRPHQLRPDYVVTVPPMPAHCDRPWGHGNQNMSAISLWILRTIFRTELRRSRGKKTRKYFCCCQVNSRNWITQNPPGVP